MMLITDLHLAPKLRMSEFIHLYAIMSWTGTSVIFLLADVNMCLSLNVPDQVSH